MAQPGLNASIKVWLTDEERELLEYWANKRGVSKSSYMRDALLLMIRHENEDFDVPSAMVARVNQLVDLVTSLNTNQENLSRMIVTGFDSLLGLVRGENYLLDEE